MPSHAQPADAPLLPNQNDSDVSNEIEVADVPVPAAPRPRWRSLLTAGVKVACGVVVLYTAQQALSSYIPNPFHRRRTEASNTRAYAVASRQAPPLVSKMGGIPLPEVVRYRERQWFKDELEAARAGDTGSMIRLAKLHLAGAGCSKDVEAARYWVRNARKSGAWVTLEELILDGPDPPELPQGMTKHDVLAASAWNQPSYPAATSTAGLAYHGS